MKLVVTEKNNAATKIADLLGDTKPKADKVFDTPIYRFTHKGEEWVTIGLRGHILEPDFMPNLIYKKTKGWQAVSVEGEISGAKLPKVLPTPPWNTKRKPFTPDGIALGSWKMDALPYLAYGPIEKLPKEKGIIRSLKNLAKKADSIVIATDFDREGELIGSDALSQIREVNKDAPVSRARYSALTKGEVTKAFENLVELDTNLASAGECRQEIDLIWGAVLTRYLTLVRFAGYGNVRSSGRVQTPTLALIVAKERERKAFVPQDYWVIKARLRLNGTELEATSATERFLSSDAAHAVMAKVEGVKQATITAIETKRRTAAAPTPFNTTSLQTAAAAEGLSPARVMRIAESLYMDGYISYPRVDNTVYPASLDLDATVNMLENVPVYAPYCRKLRAAGPLKATRGKQETTDHPPIHPTAPADPDKLDPAAWKLYNLIARRFLATLSKDAIIEGTKITFDINTEPFITRGQVLVEPGFRAIYPYGMKKDAILPKCVQGDFAEVEKVTCEQKQTEPPARYSQGRLIQEMEKLGLGTKATRHSIIERLYTVKYIQNDPIEPSQLGIAVIDALDKFAPAITTHTMTAELESDMNDIAEGKSTQEGVVTLSRDMLYNVLQDLIPHADEVAEALGDAVAADAYVGPCPKCGKDLQLRASQKTRSMFIGCAGWPDCDVTYPLPSGKIESTQDVCNVCGMPQIKVTAFRSKPRMQCIDPHCDTNKEADVVVGICHECAKNGLEKKLVAQKNPRTLKRFIRCENYDECNVGYPLPPTGEISATNAECEHCGAPMVTVTTARGPWTLCPNFSCSGKEKSEKKGRARTARTTKKKK